MSKLVVFGAGDIARLAKFYFDTDSEHEVVAFTVDKAYKQADSFLNLPLVEFDEIEKFYSPQHYEFFVALSYTNYNRLRAAKYLTAKSKGYKIASYISSKCSYLSQFPAGENAFILEDNTIQPYVKIGNNVTLWSGNHIGHDSVIKDHNFISSHVVISGHCVINEYCFLGVNSTLHNEVEIGENSLVAAGAIISKSIEGQSVYVPARSLKLDKTTRDIKI